MNVKFLVENGMDMLSLRVWLVGPVRKSSNVAAFGWVCRMADDSCHAGIFLFLPCYKADPSFVVLCVFCVLFLLCVCVLVCLFVSSLALSF